MAIHSSILAWTNPWTEEPGGVQSLGSQRVRHNWATNTLICICSSFCFQWVVVLYKMLSVFSYVYLPPIYLLWWGVHIFLEKATATHSSTLAWKIPWMEEPGRLQSMGSLRVRHDWATSLWLFTFMHWRKKWQPTPVFLPGESHGQKSLVGCSPWGHKMSNTTKRLSTAHSNVYSSFLTQGIVEET